MSSSSITAKRSHTSPHPLPLAPADMAGGLSSNWKNLQDRIKQDSSKPHKRKREKDEDREVTSATAITKGSPGSQRKRRRALNPRGCDITKLINPTENSRWGRGMGNSHSSRELGSDKEHKVPLEIIDAQLRHAPSSEVVADVFGLGLNKMTIQASEKERVNEGLAPGVKPGKYIALDCEMVGVGEGGYESALARVSVVDFHGAQVFDSFVKVDHRVTDWRTPITGITPETLAQALPFSDVRQQILNLIRDRIVVGHDLVHDLQVLEVDGLPAARRRDTATFGGFKKYGNGPKPKLKDLSAIILGIEIQQGHHSSIQDARIAMALFRKFKQAFDLEINAKYGEGQKGSSKKTKLQKRR
ncbi:uncharacterized protein MKZ38_005323 [Zalerion maritima]|uniref:RNA exonuclease 4 n=1 Tax=Zalerion maritima TaxID=339359 RepID=A0AAD5RXE7_9PEZI|nr:uncharacterized protein MKZ38_005323 [Zalerion maritima]